MDIKRAKIPVFLHNFGGYDSHHIVQAYAGDGFEVSEQGEVLIKFFFKYLALISIIDGMDEMGDATAVDDDIQLTATSKGRNFSVLAKSFEKFISLGVDKHIVFKDSLNFLPSSLDSLVNNLREEAGEDKEKIKKLFKHSYSFFKKKYPQKDEILFHKYLTRKGVYPYKYMDR